MSPSLHLCSYAQSIRPSIHPCHPARQRFHDLQPSSYPSINLSVQHCVKPSMHHHSLSLSCSLSLSLSLSLALSLSRSLSLSLSLSCSLFLSPCPHLCIYVAMRNLSVHPSTHVIQPDNASMTCSHLAIYLSTYLSSLASSHPCIITLSLSLSLSLSLPLSLSSLSLSLALFLHAPISASTWLCEARCQQFTLSCGASVSRSLHASLK